MKLKQYLKENEAFNILEDPKVANNFDYKFLKLKKPPKETAIIMKMLRKHLKTPLKSLQWKSGTQGSRNLAVYSESMDSMAVNLSYAKKLKKGSFSTKVNYNERLENAKDSLEKWLEFQEKATSPKDIRKARGAVNNLKVTIRNLEDKINKGETPVPQVSNAYANNLEESIEMTVLHELGHREKHKSDMFKLQVFFNQGQFPTEYSKHNISEYHSEVYALTKMKKIDKAPISDEAKAYFKKAFK